MATSLLSLSAYRQEIDLDEPFRPMRSPALPAALGNLTRIALRLLGQDPWIGSFSLPADASAGRRLLGALLRIREPAPMDARLTAVLDALLGGERQLNPVVLPLSLPTVADVGGPAAYPQADRVVLWRGDITTLMADAIIHPVNSTMLGCFHPMHDCVESAVHAAAGPRLREDCGVIMQRGSSTAAPAGTTVLTRAYHLSARYVVHTAAPQRPEEPDEALLGRCYHSALSLAARVPGIRTVGLSSFGCAGGGIAGAQAARVALAVVSGWLEHHPGRFDRVVLATGKAEVHGWHHAALRHWRSDHRRSLRNRLRG